MTELTAKQRAEKAHNDRQKAAGFRKLCVFVHDEDRETIRKLVKLWSEKLRSENNGNADNIQR